MSTKGTVGLVLYVLFWIGIAFMVGIVIAADIQELTK